MLSDVGSFIPLEMQKYSPIIMGATAGMRLLSPED
jgi:Golgi nucleoside diphosphatase